jgi:hypothetical protein
MVTGGILGALILAVNIYVIYRILTGGGSGLSKVLWIAVVLIFPILGVILWWLLGKK